MTVGDCEVTKEHREEADRWLMAAAEAMCTGEMVRVDAYLVQPEMFMNAPPLRMHLGPIPLPRLPFKWYRRWEERVHALRLVEQLRWRYYNSERRGMLH